MRRGASIFRLRLRSLDDGSSTSAGFVGDAKRRASESLRGARCCCCRDSGFTRTLAAARFSRRAFVLALPSDSSLSVLLEARGGLSCAVLQ